MFSNEGIKPQSCQQYPVPRLTWPGCPREMTYMSWRLMSATSSSSSGAANQCKKGGLSAWSGIPIAWGLCPRREPPNSKEDMQAEQSSRFLRPRPESLTTSFPLHSTGQASHKARLTFKGRGTSPDFSRQGTAPASRERSHWPQDSDLYNDIKYLHRPHLH